VNDMPEGGGTDAAFAALNTKAPVIERFGLQGYGAHSVDAEYVLLDSIEPRLYLLARMIMDVSKSKGSPECFAEIMIGRFHVIELETAYVTNSKFSRRISRPACGH
jgi:hypothetical protein